MTRPGLCAAFLAIAVAAGGAGFGAAMPKMKPIASGYLDAHGAGLKQPEGVAYDGKSLVVVADTGNARLVEYTFTGDGLKPFAEIALPQLPYPIRVQIDSKGVIYALDGKSRRIVRVSPSGEFKGYVEPGETDPAHPMVPRSFRIDRAGVLYILDVASARVLALDPEGKVVRKIDFPREAGFFSDLAVGDSGTVFLVDSVGRRVYSAPAASTAASPLSPVLGEDLDFPTAIAVDARGNLLVVDQNGGGIVVLGRDGSFRGRQLGMGWKEGLLRYPSQISAGAGGEVFVADRGNNRVQVFRSIE